MINELFYQKIDYDDICNDHLSFKDFKSELQLELKESTKTNSGTVLVEANILRGLTKQSSFRNLPKADGSEITLINKKRVNIDVDKEKSESLDIPQLVEEDNHSETSNSSNSDFNARKPDIRHKFKEVRCEKRLKARAMDSEKLNDIFCSYYLPYWNNDIRFNESESSSKSDFTLNKLIEQIGSKSDSQESVLPAESVSKHYLRRRICSHLYKVLSIIANKSLSDEEMRALTLDIELKARVKDPQMGNCYKSIISGLFDKIKKIFN